MEYLEENNDINDFKRRLSNELLENLRKGDNRLLDTLLLCGYSYEEINELLTRYQDVSGLDLINCNEIVKRTLTR